MRKSFILSVVIVFIVFIYGCNQKRDSNDHEVTTDETYENKDSSGGAQHDPKDSVHKFVRTADLKFRVDNVINATNDIEDIVRYQKGFVTYTNLVTSKDNFIETAVSADSALQTAYYTTTNSITLRVPNRTMDTTLKQVAKLVGHLDHRVIKADDVSLQITANKLAQKRSSKTEARIENAIDTHGKKLNEVGYAEDDLSGIEEKHDQAALQNISLDDQVNFSTVTIDIYEKQKTEKEIVSIPKAMRSYEPGLGTKLWESIKTGWAMIEALIVFLANFWAIIGFIIAGYFGYKKLKLKYNLPVAVKNSQAI